jgi:hypothetical protein
MWRVLRGNKPLHHGQPRVPNQGNLAIAPGQLCKILNHIVTIPAAFAGMPSGIKGKKVRVGSDIILARFLYVASERGRT